MISLYLGGVRSGKSRLAEAHAERLNTPVTYIATAQAFDDEMRQRIQVHAGRRPAHWSLIEAPLALADAISQAPTGDTLLIDCLSVWVTNQLISEESAPWPDEQTDLIKALRARSASVILVSAEASRGITPTGELSRTFLDRAGLLHQAIAETADNVFLVTAGLMQTLKGCST